MFYRSSALLVLPFLALLTAAPCRADQPAGLTQAHSELQAALNEGGPPPSPADQEAHLKAAQEALQSLPPNYIRGRAQAASYIRSAIYDIKHGGTPNQIGSDIHQADEIVRDME
jgi:hypothetical protein